MKFKSEQEFITRIQRLAQRRSDGLVRGIGDDAAVIESSRGLRWCLTTDLLIEGIHFDLRHDSPHSVGHKSLAAGLSDVAAMGATPRFALISIAVPSSRAHTFLPCYYRGFMELADRHQVALMGGDTSRARSQIFIDVIVVGSVRAGREILRSGARAGDHIFVTGALGKAALGLDLLRRGKSPSEGMERLAVASHLYPTPRTGVGVQLCKAHIATSMIDISDGLSTDLNHLCRESAVGARVYETRFPLLGEGLSKRRLRYALTGGEDYELLFTVRSNRVAELREEIGGVPVSDIGRIVPRSKGVRIVRANGTIESLTPAGWDHFR
ncbi:MAG: thiamine-phosphate kinase [Acidobacteriia bacterium]|nr:thiamine-phosphate kinase [Terriglobia bacterium]